MELYYLVIWFGNGIGKYVGTEPWLPVGSFGYSQDPLIPDGALLFKWLDQRKYLSLTHHNLVTVQSSPLMARVQRIMELPQLWQMALNKFGNFFVQLIQGNSGEKLLFQKFQNSFSQRPKISTRKVGWTVVALGKILFQCYVPSKYSLSYKIVYVRLWSFLFNYWFLTLKVEHSATIIAPLRIESFRGQ